MRMLVVGAGATGGYFGGRLAQHGRDVSFLVRPARAAALRGSGLQLVSPHGNATITPSVIATGELRDRFDAVLLTVKAWSLPEALDDVAPAVGPDTMILPVLNGMRHVDAIATRFTPDNLVGCVCRVATSLREDGVIVQLAPFQEVSYGEMHAPNGRRIAALDDFMRNAGFDARASAVIEHEMWEKWVTLATLGGMTCLLRGNVGEIVAVDGGRDFVLALLREVTRVAAAAGFPMSEAFLARTRSMLTAEGSSFASSMYRDLVQGQRIEADQIVGDLVRRGRQLGIAMPLLEAAWSHLQIVLMRIGSAAEKR
ncbi:MAG TPA: ketopantoate reductase family protein [Acetobacteraceae bacterium]|jgi:2-dehydropantoate 2-reductase|nr:ketopantoate reductase family protein [Acetobacteraceae bacterium]